MNLNKSIKEFKSVIPAINQKYRPYAEQVVNLFKDRKIEKRKEAVKLLDQLSSRGKGPQSAIKKITEKYSKAESAKGKLMRPTTQTYFISGMVQREDTYKKKLKKLGEIKERSFVLPHEPYSLTVKAKNKAEAEEIFQAGAKQYFESTFPDSNSNTEKTSKFKGATIGSIKAESEFTPASEGSQLMKAVSPIEYSFIPADTSPLKNNDFCVLDQFLGIYSPLIINISIRTILLIIVIR